MPKGQAAIVLLVLAIIAVALLIFWPSISQLFGSTIPEFKYKNDIITVEDFSISSLNPYPNSLVEMKFVIRNNGDKDVDDVKVRFNLQGGLTTEKLLCSNKDKTEERVCTSEDFGVIEPADERPITLSFRTPNKELIQTPSVFTIDYSVEYTYSSNRIAQIPVIDGITRKKPFGKFTQSSPSYGPIKLDVEPPVGSTRIENNKQIKEYWMYSGASPTEVKIKLSYQDSSSIGKVEDTLIKNLKLDLKNTLFYESSKGLYCDFEGSDILTPKEDIKLPARKTVELGCNLEFKGDVNVPESTAIIEAEFSYVYKYTKTQNINVRPALVE